MTKGLNLQKFRKNYFSQGGEDGILSKIFNVLKINKGWCVELGAWDGIYLSNTYHLIKDKAWKGVFIEADRERYLQLIKNFKNMNSLCINSYVEASGKNSLDRILSKTPILKDFDLLSIDIDGNDYYIWENLKKYQPKIVIIEFNSTIPLEVEFIQPQDPKINQGTSLAALNKLARSKNYSLVATTETNAIFMKNKFLHLLRVANTDPAIIWSERKELLTYFFQLYDGTIVIRGNRLLRWYGISIEDKNIQLIPKIFRHFPPTMFDTIGSLIYLGNWKQFREALSKIFRSKKLMISNIRERLISTKLLKAYRWLEFTWKISLNNIFNDTSTLNYKQEMIKKMGRNTNIDTLVETGTYLGDMVFANLNSFKNIYSIELDKRLYERAKKRFKNYNHVIIYHGDSAIILNKIVKNLKQKTLFWLDAHYSGGVTSKTNKETPIKEELKIIIKNWEKGNIVLIDDAKLFNGNQGYPTIEKIKSIFSKITVRLKVEKDIIVIK
jgi:hypothetical protein